MAIAKMKKVTLISFHEKKEQLLTAIQTLQSLEVIDLPAAKENLQSLSPKERELSGECHGSLIFPEVVSEERVFDQTVYKPSTILVFGRTGKGCGRIFFRQTSG